jgi:hypothetical protein
MDSMVVFNGLMDACVEVKMVHTFREAERCAVCLASLRCDSETSLVIYKCPLLN